VNAPRGSQGCNAQLQAQSTSASGTTPCNFRQAAFDTDHGSSGPAGRNLRSDALCRSDNAPHALWMLRNRDPSVLPQPWVRTSRPPRILPHAFGIVDPQAHIAHAQCQRVESIDIKKSLALTLPAEAGLLHRHLSMCARTPCHGRRNPRGS
jgi:hypothetical protein